MSKSTQITIIAVFLAALALGILGYFSYAYPEANLLSTISRVARIRAGAKYPKTAKYNLHPDLREHRLYALAQYDVLIVDMEAQHLCPERIAAIRKMNPDIKILAFVSMIDIRIDSDQNRNWNQLRHQLYSQVNEKNWWLWDSNRRHVWYWPETYMTNPTTGWRDYLPQFVHDEILATGIWDGIVFDNVWDQASWVNNGNLDLNNDRVPETASKINQSWRHDMTYMLAKMRRLNPDTIIITNGDGDYRWYINGRHFEELPNIYENGYIRMRDKYLRFEQTIHRRPKINIVNGSVIFKDIPDRPDWRLMRLSLATALMGDGYHDYDWGHENHNEGYRFDEYNVDLGEPVSGPMKIQMYAEHYNDFENGMMSPYRPTAGKSFVTFNPREVVDGRVSIKGDNRSGGTWNDFFRSDLNAIRFDINGTYTATFKYKILLGPEPGGYFYVMAQNRYNGQVEGFRSWTLKDGQVGEISTVFELGQRDDYQLVFGVSGSGAISLDNIAITPGDSDIFVWRRDYANAMVLANPTPVRQRVILPEPYVRIDGKQEPNQNNGRIIGDVYLEPHDGIIIKKLSRWGKLKVYTANIGNRLKEAWQNIF